MASKEQHHHKLVSPNHLVIDANFTPPAGMRFVKLMTSTLAGLVVLVMLLGWITTALVVHFESQVSQVSQQTRQQNEDTRNLQVKLQQLQSYQRVAYSATQMPHLQPVGNNRVTIQAQANQQVVWPTFKPRVVRQLPPLGY